MKANIGELATEALELVFHLQVEVGTATLAQTMQQRTVGPSLGGLTTLKMPCNSMPNPRRDQRIDSRMKLQVGVEKHTLKRAEVVDEMWTM